MDKRDFNVSVESIPVFSPLIAASLMGAYYSSLLLQQQRGVEVTKDLEAEILVSIFRQWVEMTEVISQRSRKSNEGTPTNPPAGKP